MSRTKILATTALVALGTSCLIATEASARTATSFVHTSGGHATASRAATFAHAANVSRPANIARPVRLAHLSGVGPSTTLSHGNVASHGLTQLAPSNAATHGLTHTATTNTTLKSGTVPTLNGHQASKIVPSPTSNAGMITVLTNQATADAKAAKAATAEAKQDRATAASDARGAAIFQRGADASARKAAAEAQSNPALAAKDAKAAAEQRADATILRVKGDVARLEATAAQDKAKVLTNNAKAETAAANKLANGTIGNGTTATQQGNGQGGAQTNGQGGAQTNGQSGAQTNGQGTGQGNAFPGNGGGFPVSGAVFAGNGGGVAPSNAGITNAPVASNGFASSASTQSGGTAFSNPPVLQNNPAPRNTTLKALALVWNPDGRWVVRSATQLDAANDDALKACNSQFGNCTASGATVDTAAFGCLGVASNGTDEHQLFAAMGASLDEVRASLTQQMTTSGVTGQIKYSACNA